MASLYTVGVLLVVAICGVRAAAPTQRPGVPAYDFDYRAHLKNLNTPGAATRSHAPSPGHAHGHAHSSDDDHPRGCQHHAHSDDGHEDDDDSHESHHSHHRHHDDHHRHRHHRHSERKSRAERASIEEDDDDSEMDGVPEELAHLGCGLCGGDHSDEDHDGHAHRSGHAHNHNSGHAHHSGCPYHSSHAKQSGHAHEHHEWERTYRFRIGMDMPKTGYLYKNDEGRVEGFLIDLIANVCSVAGKVCHPVVDVKDRCWQAATDSPGTGLVAGWYDGCVGFFPTPEKYDSFNFSLPFSLNPTLAMHYAAGKVPDDVTKLEGKKIGFIRGLPMNAACLSRQAAFQGKFTAVQFDSLPRLAGALSAGRIDGFPWMANFTDPKLPVEGRHPTFSCSSQGLSVMARQGDPLLSWWNAAYRLVVQSGSYSDLCRQARERPGYKGRVYCLESQFA